MSFFLLELIPHLKTLKLSSLLLMVSFMKVSIIFILKLFLSIFSTFNASMTMLAKKFMMINFILWIFTSLSILFSDKQIATIPVLPAATDLSFGLELKGTQLCF